MRVHRLQVRNIEDLLLATGGNREFRPVQMGPRNVTGELAMTTAGGLTLTYGKFVSDIHVSGTWSNEKLTLGAVLAAEGIRVFGKPARPGDIVVAGKAREVDARYEGRLKYLAINVDKAAVRDVAEAHGWKIAPGLLAGSDLLHVDAPKAIRLIERMKTVAERIQAGGLERIGPAMEWALADHLLLEFARGMSVTRFDDGTRIWQRRHPPSLVQRTEELLNDDASGTRGVVEFARKLGVSPRQLYRSFHAEVGMSPAKYLKRYRMTQARLDLLRADPAETTVTEVAVSWRFWELGRFAGEYRRLFGEHPSRTLRTYAGGRGSVTHRAS
jgi:AraC family ethanolamine operon transcriptional activator